MGTYVVGDIHGCFDEWIELKNRIEDQDPKAVFILVGDIVDRGPKVMEMVRWAMKHVTEDGKYQMLCGNHEQEKIEWFCEFLLYHQTRPWADYRIWKKDGYDFQENLKANRVFPDQLEAIIRFFQKLPVFKELYIDTGKKRGKQHYVVVHAYLPRDCVNRDESVRKRALVFPKSAEDMNRIYQVAEKRYEVVWKRNYSGYDWLKSTIVLHGHTPTLSEDIFAVPSERGRICYEKNDINLDCGIVYRREGCNLAAIRLEDLEEFYLYPVNGEPKGRSGRIIRLAQEQLRGEMLELIHGKRHRESS